MASMHLAVTVVAISIVSVLLLLPSVVVANAVAPTTRRVLRGQPPCRTLGAGPYLRVGSSSLGASVQCEAQDDHNDNAIKSVPDVTGATWQSLVVESELPVLVEFWAMWCDQPCRVQHVAVHVASNKFEGKMKFYRLDVEKDDAIASKFDIKALPTVIIMKKGTMIGMLRGRSSSPSALISFINKYV